MINSRRQQIFAANRQRKPRSASPPQLPANATRDMREYRDAVAARSGEEALIIVSSHIDILLAASLDADARRCGNTLTSSGHESAH